MMTIDATQDQGIILQRERHSEPCTHSTRYAISCRSLSCTKVTLLEPSSIAFSSSYAQAASPMYFHHPICFSDFLILFFGPA